MKRKNSTQPFSWHRQYLRQAEWTRALRLHLYRKVGLARCRTIMELGCGTGAIAGELAGRTGALVCGLDKDHKTLSQARKNYPNIVTTLLAADASMLPFEETRFDLIISHYFWMWIDKPANILAECLRILRPGGHLIALAEPDYGGRTDYPAQLTTINEQLTEELIQDGADPFVGRKLEGMFQKAGLATEAGSIEQGWVADDHRREFEEEWRMIGEVLKGVKGLKRLKEIERRAIANRTRRSTMPVHWVVGKKE